MLEKVRHALRRTSTDFDDEIQDCISFVLKDLADVGVRASVDDIRVQNMCILYAKSYFNFDNKADWFQTQYAKNKRLMASQGDYELPKD